MQVGWSYPKNWVKFVTDVSEIIPVVLVLFSLVIVIAPTWISWNFLLPGYKCTEGMLQKQLGGGSGKIGSFLSFSADILPNLRLKYQHCQKKYVFGGSGSRVLTPIYLRMRTHTHTRFLVAGVGLQRFSFKIKCDFIVPKPQFRISILLCVNTLFSLPSL